LYNIKKLIYIILARSGWSATCPNVEVDSN